MVQFLHRGENDITRHDYARAVLEFRNATQLDPKNAEPVYQLGLAYLAAGDLNQAGAVLLRATQLNPKHEQAQVKVAELMARNGDLISVKEGEKRMLDLLATSPENVDVLNSLALLELRLGKVPDAESHLNHALEKAPGNLKSSEILARLDLERHDPKAAERILRKAVELAPQSQEAANAFGELYSLTDRWAEAEEQFQRSVKIDPQSPQALLHLASAQVHLGHKEQAEHTYRVLSSLPDKQYKHLHAVFLFQEGKRDAAIQELEKIANANHNDRDSRNRLVEAYLAANRGPDAVKILTSALKSNPKDVDALLYRSSVLLASGKDKEAESDLGEVIRYQPDSAQAHYRLAAVYQTRGDKLRQREELVEALKYKPDLWPARAELARSLLWTRAAKNALDVLDATPADQKSNFPILAERNWALLAMEDEQGFQTGVEQGLRLARLPEFLLQDAVARIAKKDYSGAQRSLGEMLSAAPEDSRALTLLGETYLAQKQPEKALQALQDHASKHPSSAAVQQFVGEWLMAAHRPEEARAAFEAAKAVDPNYRGADLALARVDFGEGKLDSARIRLQKILATDRGNIKARLLLAALENKSGDAKAAISEYRKVIDADARNLSALNNLAYLLTDVAGQPDEGLKYAQEARELAPGDIDVEGTIGWAFYRKGLYDTALKYLQEAVSKDAGASSENSVIRQYHLSMAYLRIGDRKRGLASLEAASRVNPKLPEAKLALQVASETAATHAN